MDDDNPGFGASRITEAGKLVPGNTFDFPAVHGKALLKEGYAFSSCSSEAFAENASLAEGCFAIYAPQDGHLPGMKLDGVEKCRRVVVKVKC